MAAAHETSWRRNDRQLAGNRFHRAVATGQFERFQEHIRHEIQIPIVEVVGVPQKHDVIGCPQAGIAEGAIDSLLKIGGDGRDSR